MAKWRFCSTSLMSSAKFSRAPAAAMADTSGRMGYFLIPATRSNFRVNYCMQFVADGSAVFVLNSQTSKEEKLIAELEAKGYQFAINSKPAREREEFQSVIARKKSRSPWMAGVITPSPGTA